MSKLEVNAVEPQCGTNLTLGASGDTIIIPSGATISNQGTAAGFGPTGAVSWNTTKITANPNPAVSGVGYFCDTTSAAFTVTLPATPAAGAVIGIADYANTFATNNLTVNRNGSKIAGSTNNAVLSTNGVSVTFVYVDATQGWIVTDSGNRSDLPVPQYIVATGGTVSCCGDYKIHTFTGPGTFTVCSVGNPAGSTTVDYLVIAGGGGGGGSQTPPVSNQQGGGGGAGGYRTNYPSPTTTGLPVTATGYPITVGAGGAGGPGTPPVGPTGSNGNNSIFSTITSTAGGGGGAGCNAGTNRNGNPGGSGGGGGGSDATPVGTGGSGNTPPTSPSQGNNGGAAAGGNIGGSGGGAGASGSTPPVNSTPAAGGAGLASSITGSSVTRAVGGATKGTPGGNGDSASNNTGSGGQGAFNGNGGSGGSGIIVIRYRYK